MREDDNDLGFDDEFFKSRSRIKNPKAQKKIIDPQDDETPVLTMSKKKRTKGNAYQHTKTGARPDLNGIVCRSSWEADVLRVLQLFKIQFEFEPTTFYFPADVNGRVQAYLPDIYLNKTNEYIEVKGMLDARGRNKLRKFKKHYPEEFKTLTVIISKSNKTNKFFFKKLGVKNIIFYEHLIKLYSPKLPNWEGGRK